MMTITRIKIIMKNIQFTQRLYVPYRCYLLYIVYGNGKDFFFNNWDELSVMNCHDSCFVV